jgi:RTX calcium-binding nonapeptide repeat (4 copies)
MLLQNLRVTAPLALVALALALLAIPATASSEGEIVIHGPASSSHLRLTVSGNALVVDGYLDRRHQVGCREGRHNVICPLAGVDRVEVDMGPENDKVEVLDPLPVPLTARLGAGSDKFIGNGERDTCYSQGSRRNRCVGGAGNDVCITGQRNSDCVGGPGNDYCRTGAGSDGCWGGPGNDVCVMGPGEDGCHGEGGNDKLYGGPGADQLYGGSGWDYCDGFPGMGRSHECAVGPRH